MFTCAALLVVASGPTLVSPLYPLYQNHYGLSNATIGLIASVYAVSLIPAMLIAGPLSDRWGRPALLVPGLGLFVLADGLSRHGSFRALRWGRSLAQAPRSPAI
ncbi:MAG: hypothetical protein DMD92_10650 [Candidatus Rokuibacteriota bacterium]|nr:MAG: hypothetical protein DMD92_10650 [Candidatus Rokubacteria bacterium]